MGQFCTSLSNRFQALQNIDEDQSLENKWQRTRKAWMDTCEKTVGRKTRQHEEWITAETLKKVQIRKVRKEDLNNSRTRGAEAIHHCPQGCEKYHQKRQTEFCRISCKTGR